MQENGNTDDGAAVDVHAHRYYSAAWSTLRQERDMLVGKIEGAIIKRSSPVPRTNGTKSHSMTKSDEDGPSLLGFGVLTRMQ